MVTMVTRRHNQQIDADSVLSTCLRSPQFRYARAASIYNCFKISIVDVPINSLWLFYDLVTSMVISGHRVTCDSAYLH